MQLPSRNVLAVKASVSLVFVYLLLISFSFLGFPLGPGLDESYFAALNVLLSSGARYGVDIETTYGPFGYLCSPNNFGQNIFFSNLLGIFLSVLGALGLLVGISARTREIKVAILILWSLSHLFYTVQTRDYQLLCTFLVCLMVFLANIQKKNLWLLFTAALIASFSVFVKFNNALIMVLDLFVALLIIAVSHRDFLRSALAAVLLFLLATSAIASFYFANPSAFVSFIQNSFDVASAYSLVMSSADKSVLPLLAAAAFFLLFAFYGLLLLKNKSYVLTPLVLSAVPLLMAFKHSFIREGNICKFPFVALVCLSLTLLFSMTRKQQVCLLILAGLLLLFVPSRLKELQITNHNPVFELVGYNGMRSVANFVQLNEVRADLDELTAQRFAAGKLPEEWLNRLRKAKNGVDCIPIEIFYCFANQLKWHPNPPIQLAYAITPKLDKWCVNWYSAANAADFLLVGFPDCDWRHPFFTCPETWRTILRHYRSAGIDMHHQQVFLEQRATPLTEKIEKIIELDCAKDLWIPLPLDSEFLIAKFSLKQTLLGAVQKALYRIDPIYMDVAYIDGKFAYFRFLPNTADGGILISPLPRDLEGMHSLFCGTKLPSTTFIKLHGPGLAAYQKRIKIEIHRATYSN